MWRSAIFIIALLLLTAVVVTAQDDCPAIVQRALEATDLACLETGRNEACFGNSLLELTPKANVRIEAFETPGDKVSLSAIESMTLNPLDEQAGTWGVVMMRLQASIPDSLPGQNVTFVLFGDVKIENAVEEGSTDFTPMQAFYFTSGIGDAPCEQAPESGIMIQTPQGVKEVTMNVNGANLTLGSTAYLQAYSVPGATDGSGEMAVSVVEGRGRIEVDGVEQEIPAGSWLRVPMRFDPERRGNLENTPIVAAPPQIPIPYREAKFSVLPAQLLEEEIEVMKPLTQEQIAQSLSDAGVPLPSANDQFTGIIMNIRVENTFNTTSTFYVDGQRYVVAAGETMPIDVMGSLHNFTVCNGGKCVSFKVISKGGETYEISERTFRLNR